MFVEGGRQGRTHLPEMRARNSCISLDPTGSWRPVADGVSCMCAVDRAERHTLVCSLIQLRERLSTSLCVSIKTSCGHARAKGPKPWTPHPLKPYTRESVKESSIKTSSGHARASSESSSSVLYAHGLWKPNGAG